MISPSSCPLDQPAYPAKMRIRWIAPSSSAGGTSRSISPIRPKHSRQPGGSADSITSATASALSVPTGPPMNSTPGSFTVVDQSGSTRSTARSAARFTTTPSAPSSS